MNKKEIIDVITIPIMNGLGAETLKIIGYSGEICNMTIEEYDELLLESGVKK